MQNYLHARCPPGKRWCKCPPFLTSSAPSGSCASAVRGSPDSRSTPRAPARLWPPSVHSGAPARSHASSPRSIHIGDLALLRRVGADGLSEFIPVVPMTSSMSSRIWKASPRPIAVLLRRCQNSLCTAACGGHAQHAGTGNHGAGFLRRCTSASSVSVFGAWSVSSTWPATMPSAPAALARIRPPARRGAPPAVSGAPSTSDKSLRLEGIPRQHRQRLSVDLVVGGLAPAQVVIVHTGQIVVNQGIGMYQLQSAAHRQRQLPW